MYIINKLITNIYNIYNIYNILKNKYNIYKYIFGKNVQLGNICALLVYNSLINWKLYL